MLKITAIIAVRNDAQSLKIVLTNLAKNNISVAIIDHESTDGIQEVLRSFRETIVHVVVMPFKGYFSLTDQIALKSEIANELDTEWLIHQDADEIMDSPKKGETFRAGIERVAMEGCNVINFDEFVFLPTRPHLFNKGTDFYHSMLDYYFFEPNPFRLMRAWRKIGSISMAEGGHKLISSEPLIFPEENFILRHYLVLSKEHAMQKYLNRIYSQEDLEKGWHTRRMQFPSDFNFPDQSKLNTLPFAESKEFNRSNPWKVHFWQI